MKRLVHFGVSGAWLLGALGAGALSGCVKTEDEKPTKEDEAYVAKSILKTEPTPKYAVNANLDDKVVYLGLDVDKEPAEPGKDIKLTHYWKVLTPPGDGWRMFTHVGGPQGQDNQNNDHGPVRGKYPVARWKAGDIIRDEHTIRLPANWRHDSFRVLTGIYKGGTRLAVKSGPADNEKRVIAATIPVTSAKAAPQQRKKLVVRKISKPIKVDGKLDEPVWAEAATTGAFVNTMTGAPSTLRTEVKALWDDKNLYIAFVNVDSDVWTDFTKRDEKLWTQEAAEIMIDADGDGKSYVELQVAPNGTILDTYLPEYRKYENDLDPKRKKFDWDSKMKAAVQVDGTLNKRDDQDKSWTVEIALPLEDVKGLAAAGPKLPPALGDKWRANFFRMDQQKGKEQDAAGWSPPMVGDFHALDRFGELVFGDEKGQVPTAISTTPPTVLVGAAAKAGEGQPDKEVNKPAPGHPQAPLLKDGLPPMPEGLKDPNVEPKGIKPPTLKKAAAAPAAGPPANAKK